MSRRDPPPVSRATLDDAMLRAERRAGADAPIDDSMRRKATGIR